MIRPFEIRDFLERTQTIAILDVRSPSEFFAGHIPGAHSLPLFDDQERAILGTLYKQQGKQDAVLKGLQFAGVKMQSLATQALALASDKKIAVYCWRGGMRSASVAWLLTQIGLEVFLLKGGYKSYRRFCLESFNLPRKLSILGGKTGTQKTKILNALKSKNIHVVDLEALACHRGSAFGYAKDGLQPTQEQFENDLAFQLRSSDPSKTLWLEDESRLIGRLRVPDSLWKQMRNAPVYVLEWPIEKRIQYLLEDYPLLPDKIEANLQAIKNRLGSERHSCALKALAENRYADLCSIILDYYDRAYSYGLSLRDPTTISYLPADRAIEEILSLKPCLSD